MFGTEFGIVAFWKMMYNTNQDCSIEHLIDTQPLVTNYQGKNELMLQLSITFDYVSLKRSLFMYARKNIGGICNTIYHYHILQNLQ